MYFAGGKWVLGNEGDSCEETCSKTESVCNTNAQSNLTTNELISKKMLEAGYECRTFFEPIRYIQAPLADPLNPSGNSNAMHCGAIAVGTESICDISVTKGIRRLCYCQKGK